jgi:hypothetical protein
MFVNSVSKGRVLKQVDIVGLEHVAPLMYKLEIPVDIFIPDTVPMVLKRTFAKNVLGRVSEAFDASVWKAHRIAREDKADFFCALVDIFGTIPFHLTGTSKVNWRLFGFNIHYRELDHLCGIDNLVYLNVSKKRGKSLSA